LILFDGIHIVSDNSIEELHKFANKTKIGLKREWFQDHPYPHYNVVRSKILLIQKLLKPEQLIQTKELLTRVQEGK